MSVEPKTTAVQPPEPQLPILRFSLRHLFWFVTLSCVLTAMLVAAWDSGVTALAMLLATSVVVLHVSGTAIGFRLRAHADERQAWEASRGVVHLQWPTRQRTLETHVVSRSPLHGHGIPLRRLPLWVAAGAVAGGLLGIVLLTATIGHRTSAVGVAVGAVSLAVLGAWFAFVAGSSWAIFRQGWHDAVSEHQRDQFGGSRRS